MSESARNAAPRAAPILPGAIMLPIADLRAAVERDAALPDFLRDMRAWAIRLALSWTAEPACFGKPLVLVEAKSFNWDPLIPVRVGLPARLRASSAPMKCCWACDSDGISLALLGRETRFDYLAVRAAGLERDVRVRVILVQPLDRSGRRGLARSLIVRPRVLAVVAIALRRRLVVRS